MVFSNNVKEDVKREIMTLWGTKGIQQYERYLGLPLSMEGPNEKPFQILKLAFGSSFNHGKAAFCLKGEGDFIEGDSSCHTYLHNEHF